MYLVQTRLPEVPIADLGQVVRRGQELWVTTEQYEGSLCLRELQRMGSVQVTLRERSRVVKEAPMSKKNRPKARPSRPAVSRLPRKKPGEIRYTQAEVDEMINQAVEKAVEKTLERLPKSSPAPAPVVSPELLEAALAQALARVAPAQGSVVPQSRVSSPQDPPSPDLEEPMFIPEGIVTTDSSEIQVKSESAESGAIGDAAVALRQLKKSRETK